MALFVVALFAALRSIGVALTVVAVGVYLGRQGLLSAAFRKSLSELSVRVTIPALLFTKVLFCEQCQPANHISIAGCKECVPLAEVIASAWVLLLMPALVVGLGAALGKAVAVLFACPPNFSRGCITAVAFGNSTGMPIVLLSVLQQAFASRQLGALGQVDPILLLPVYLVFYPVLQWSIGGWLLGLGEGPAQPGTGDTEQQQPLGRREEKGEEAAVVAAENERGEQQEEKGAAEAAQTPIRSCLGAALEKVLVPPVLAAVLGVIVGLTPLRGLLVDIADQDADAPLQWLYDGLSALGRAAVPLNLLSLGAALSGGADWSALPPRVAAAIALSKLVLVPAIMLGAVHLLARAVPMPASTAAAVWLVVLVVSATPTANNIATMAELGGQSKEAMATAIFLQYLLAPVAVSGSLVVIITLLASESYMHP